MNIVCRSFLLLFLLVGTGYAERISVDGAIASTNLEYDNLIGRVRTLILNIPEVRDEIRALVEAAGSKRLDEDIEMAMSEATIESVQEIKIDGQNYMVAEAIYFQAPHSLERHILAIIKELKEVVYFTLDHKHYGDFQIIKNIFPGVEVLFFKNHYGYYWEWGEGFSLVKMKPSPKLLLDLMFGGHYLHGENGVIPEVEEGEAGVIDLDGDGLKEIIIRVTPTIEKEDEEIIGESKWFVYKYSQTADTFLEVQDKNMIKKAQHVWPQAEQFY